MNLQRAVYVGLVTLALLAVGCSEDGDDPDVEVDATVSDTSDADVGDSDEMPSLTCSNLQEKWGQFLEENETCELDDDCTIVSDWTSCDCSPSLTGGGVGLNKEASSDAQLYIDKAQSDECKDQFRTCDAAPSENVRCEDGTCTVDSNSCLNADAGG